jgi:LacI family transcriptional regulator
VGAVRKKVTLRDIAKKLNISPSTVSRALSGAPGVGEELREKIKEIAKEMGYIPNSIAKALKKSYTRTVGVIIPDVTNPFFVEFLSGLDKVFYSNEYKFIVGNTDENVERERKYLEWFLSHGVDGIIASVTADDGINNTKFLRDISKFGVHVVLFDRLPCALEGKMDFVGIDNASAVYEALNYLKKKGHRKVGALIGKTAIYTMKRRKEAFLKNTAGLGFEVKKEWILEDLFPEESSVEEIEKLLSSKDRPSALIAFNQSLLQVFLRATKEMNMKVPDDVSVITFDDSKENEFYAPPISAIKQPAREMGKIAAMLLIDRISGEKSRPANIILKTELVERASVKDLRTS